MLLKNINHGDIIQDSYSLFFVDEYYAITRRPKSWVFFVLKADDECHVTLVCEQFADAGKKYFKKYFYRRPSMAKFVELINTKSDYERYRLMLFVMLFVVRI